MRAAKCYVYTLKYNWSNDGLYLYICALHRQDSEKAHNSKIECCVYNIYFLKRKPSSWGPWQFDPEALLGVQV